MIPIKCCTCGNVLANKYRTFRLKVRAKKIAIEEDVDKMNYLTKDNCEKTIEGQILDEFDIMNFCCRRIMLTSTET